MLPVAPCPAVSGGISPDGGLARVLRAHRPALLAGRDGHRAVERLKADEVVGAHFHHRDPRLANQTTELADAC
ncbi:hypothetical protein GCM10010234_48920 [Streptomyces hawaiiensis]